MAAARPVDRRPKMARIITRGGVACLLVVAATAGSAQENQANRVTVVGCPTPGVTATCLMIQGPDGQVYNITAANPRPMPGDRVIRLTGRKTDRLSMCLQGIVLDDIKWSSTEQKCPK